MEKTKLFLLGIDGMPFYLLEEWTEKGYLPTINQLKKEGCFCVLESIIPSLTTAVIPAMYTGQNIGKTGMIGFTKKDGSLFSFKDISQETFWEILNRNGFKTAIYNLPATYPPRKVDGVLVSGCLTPSKESEFTFPKELKNKYNFPIAKDLGKMRKTLERKELVEEFKVILKKDSDIFLDIVKKEDYDFCCFYIKDSDNLQHFIFKSKDLLLEYYKFIDIRLKKMMGEIKPENIIIFSDHGFEEAPDYNFYINHWLKEQDLLKIKGNKITNSLITKTHKITRNIVPFKIVQKAVKIIKRIKNKRKIDASRIIPGVDWKNTLVFGELNWGINIIKENLKKIDYEKLRDELILKLKDVEFDGKKVIREIYKREEIYHGEYIKDIPDIVFTTEKGFNITMYLSDVMFSEDKAVKIKGYEGEHSSAKEGIFVAFGKDIKKEGRIDNQSIMNIAPTILCLFNNPIPEIFDGNIIKNALKNTNYSIEKISSQNIKIDDVEKAFSKEDEEKVKDRLRNLGYID